MRLRLLTKTNKCTIMIKIDFPYMERSESYGIDFFCGKIE